MINFKDKPLFVTLEICKNYQFFVFELQYTRGKNVYIKKEIRKLSTNKNIKLIIKWNLVNLQNYWFGLL